MTGRSRNALIELRELTEQLHANQHKDSVPKCDVEEECLEKLEFVKKRRAEKKPLKKK